MPVLEANRSEPCYLTELFVFIPITRTFLMLDTVFLLLFNTFVSLTGCQNLVLFGSK